ncbi:MAG: cysteine desulfurase [Candidatus Vogelbacteria bacterium]|nr:cysteine desulfurase [Candidatus Vogelbacteria bacterium]
MGRTYIYLDTAAATPVDGRVLAAMRPYLARDFGNPSSIHDSGVKARRAVETARAGIASILGAQADELIFTSGGTEANNLAILGIIGHRVSQGHSVSGAQIITSTIEHASVLEPCRALERQGLTLTCLPVRNDGLVDPAELKRALRPETILVSIAYANNEIGVIQPLREITRVVRKFRNVKHRVSHMVCDTRCCTPIFHTDACQAPRFLDLDVRHLGVDLMTLNSAKIYGPKGAGCLYVRRGVDLSPLVYGGGQERGYRSGTENVVGIVGFSAALELGVKLREKESVRLSKLRDYFVARLLKLEGVFLNGSPTARLPNNVNVSFAGTDSEFVVLNLDAEGVAVSSGSACSTHLKDSSYVIEALGGGRERALAAVRFSFGRDTTKHDLDYVLKILPGILSRARVGL